MTTSVGITIKSSRSFWPLCAPSLSPPCGSARVKWFTSGPSSTASASTLSCGWPSSSLYHHFPPLRSGNILHFKMKFLCKTNQYITLIILSSLFQVAMGEAMSRRIRGVFNAANFWAIVLYNVLSLNSLDFAKLVGRRLIFRGRKRYRFC